MTVFHDSPSFYTVRRVAHSKTFPAGTGLVNPLEGSLTASPAFCDVVAGLKRVQTVVLSFSSVRGVFDVRFVLASSSIQVGDRYQTTLPMPRRSEVVSRQFYRIAVTDSPRCWD